MEQTFIMIKPDGVQRGLVGEIIGRLEKKGFSLKGLKLVNVERAFAEKHYEDLSAKPFFGGLVENVIHGSDAVESARKEIALWFPDGTVNWQSSLHPWIYE
ncbi:hypothetical protein IFM89_022397 [Coptis chinensis]|uniref:Nucleoside diphosphate kinase n=1 Tax=Coptis chinensis TaxID=261450 RepID=A0A835J014_9MAGN|nr:hypothetical protein IFM89_022397 [Coptis chinensis]